MWMSVTNGMLAGKQGEVNEFVTGDKANLISKERCTEYPVTTKLSKKGIYKVASTGKETKGDSTAGSADGN